MKNLRVAAVQIPNFSGKESAKRGFEIVEPFIRKAVEEGAKFILLPEAFTGYSYVAQDIWPFVEDLSGEISSSVVLCDGTPLDQVLIGEDTAWSTFQLASLAKELNVIVAWTLLEKVQGKQSKSALPFDVINTFVLALPSGHVVKSHHKAAPAAFENFIFAGDDIVPNQQNSRIISIPSSILGVSDNDGYVNFGIAICFENYLDEVWNELANAKPRIDLLLAPHCGMSPSKSWVMPEEMVQHGKDMLNSNLLSQVLSCPMLFTNKVGDFYSKIPMSIYGWFNAGDLFFKGCTFSGHARLTDSNGNVVVECLKDEPGYIVGDVALEVRESGPVISQDSLAQLNAKHAFPWATTIPDYWNIPLGQRYYRNNLVNLSTST